MEVNRSIPQKILEALHQKKIIKQTLREEHVASISEVNYLSTPITYEDFFIKYLLPNRPCILGPWSTSDWNSRREWVLHDNRPNTSYLREKFGSAICPVADCNEVQYSSHSKEDLTLEQYLEYLENTAKGCPGEKRCLYLKDWHFVKHFPEYEAYRTPIFFRSDWMNEFWDARSDSEDDYRFVYFGPRGSWTPFHADVFRSYSWSANICGRKKWILFPPGEERNLTDKCGQLAFDLRSSEIGDLEMYPRSKGVKKRFEVVQEAGEIIFVPSGWHHQVFNLEDTISINHNWMNGCNIDISWEYIKERLAAVQHEIEDCKAMEGWNQQCQLILKADTGIDYSDFFNLLRHTASARLSILKESTPVCNADTLHSNSHHVFDIMQVKGIVEDMLQDPVFSKIITTSCPKDLYNEIDSVVNQYFNYSVDPS